MDAIGPAEIAALASGLACCGLVAAIALAAVVFLLLRSRRSPGSPAPVGTPLPAVGLVVGLPPGWTAEVLGAGVKLDLPSGYSFRLVRGDFKHARAERKTWLQETPYRSDARVLEDEPDCFFYEASEGDLLDRSFVVGKRVGDVTWFVETHGAIVEHNEPAYSAADKAELDRVQADMADALHRGEAPDGPVFQALTQRIASISARAVVDPTPKSVLVMSEDECRAAIAMVRGLRGA